jgi:hypothetical protein
VTRRVYTDANELKRKEEVGGKLQEKGREERLQGRSRKKGSTNRKCCSTVFIGTYWACLSLPLLKACYLASKCLHFLFCVMGLNN